MYCDGWLNLSSRKIFFTGFPGFIGSRLISHLLTADGASQIICLVQRKFLDKANEAAQTLWRQTGASATRLSCICGDITEPFLGLEQKIYEELAASVAEVWHLAAVYDLSINEAVARKINLEGTKNILALCGHARAFAKLIYFSTCYVSGDRTGVIKEDDLDTGQGFKNHYESTKFLAEVEVRKAMAAGLKALIIRPAIVVGDSKTGMTDKFDGPYFGMRFIDKFKWVPWGLPFVGASAAEVNLVPIDYLTQAVVKLVSLAGAVGHTFHLADPQPMLARDIYKELCLLITGKTPLGLRLPPQLVDAALIAPVRRWLGVPREVLTYFNHKAHYDSMWTQKFLAGNGLVCPAMKDYLPVIYNYWLAHKNTPGLTAKF